MQVPAASVLSMHLFGEGGGIPKNFYANLQKRGPHLPYLFYDAIT